MYYYKYNNYNRYMHAHYILLYNLKLFFKNQGDYWLVNLMQVDASLILHLQYCGYKCKLN